MTVSFHLLSLCAIASAGALPYLLLQQPLHSPQTKLVYLELLFAFLFAFSATAAAVSLPCGDSFEAAMARIIPAQAMATAVAHASLVLFGAPLFELAWESLMMAGLIAAIAAAPLAAMEAEEEGEFWAQRWARVVVKRQWRSGAEAAVFYPAVGAMIGAWAGVIPIPLDWDRPWQAWPITCVVGCLLGCATGHLYAIGRECIQWMSKRDAGKRD